MKTAAFETLAIHAGQHSDPQHGAVMEPIVLATTFAQPAPGRPIRFDYSRSGNPTRAALEACLAALEGGTFGFAFSSGCAAATTLLNTLRPGDHVVCGDDVYGGTYRIFTQVMAPLGIEVSFIDLRSLPALEAALTPRTRLIWLESPTNPMLRLVDIAGAAAIARRHGAALVVDNTFASPALQRPLALGANVVLHSTTKYVNGHSDVVGGALIRRGIKPLPLRMQRLVETAGELARRLEGAAGVGRVHYPGLPSHPQYELGRRQMSGGGGMISLELDGGLDEARRFLGALKFFTLAESLGGVESLAEHPALMTHASIPAEVRRGIGISDGLVRQSVGLEHIEDLKADLLRGLSALT